MKCHYCGTEITGREVFCRCCGTRLNPPVAENPVHVPIVPAVPVAEDPVFAARVYTPAPAAAVPESAPLFDFELAAKPVAPRIQLPTKRSLVKMLIFSILTLGIYPMVIWSRLVTELNLSASRYDGERSMPFFGMLLLMPFTLGIHSLVWMHKLCRRIGAELQRRCITCNFSAKDFWIWNFLMAFLGSIFSGTASALQFAVGIDSYWVIFVLLALGLLCTIGPLVFVHKLMKAMNLLNHDFNTNG